VLLLRVPPYNGNGRASVSVAAVTNPCSVPTAGRKAITAREHRARREYGGVIAFAGRFMSGLSLKSNTVSFVKGMSPKSVLRWREAAYFRRYGEFELRLVKALSQPDRDSIDVGANLGAYVHFMRRSSRLVYAFEPIPWLAEQLTQKFSSRVIVRNLALSDENGTATLRVPLVDGRPEAGLASLALPARLISDEFMQLLVPTRKLDDVYKGSTGFLKIDVEGCEQSVLDGALLTIDRCRPNILVEIEERFAQGCIDRTTRFLARVGYQGYFADHGVLKRIEDFDPASMQRSEDIAGFTAGVERTRFDGYVNNFIFIDRAKERAVVARIDSVLAKERHGALLPLRRPSVRANAG
jgi:FkbM family methyltransferase